MSFLASEDRVQFAAEALTVLAEQVCGYCRSYPARLDGMRSKEKQKEMRAFLENGENLTGMLGKLIHMARGIKGLRAKVNLEQLEALLETAQERVLYARSLGLLRN